MREMSRKWHHLNNNAKCINSLTTAYLISWGRNQRSARAAKQCPA
jgi:hypothetical protein